MAKELREALYRARATMAGVAQRCSLEADEHLGSLEFLQSVDRSMQAGVEDADRVLIEYEKTKIFKLWLCEHCGSYQLPHEDGEEPYCCFEPMGQVQVERMD
jgi:hypothetical protein